MQLGRILTVGALAVLAGGALAQTSQNNAGGTQNTGGTGQPGTTNSANPINMAPSGTLYKSETDYKSARANCDQRAAADRDTCRHDVDSNWNNGHSGNMGTSGTMGSNMGKTNSAPGSATAQNKCAELTGTKKEECLKTTNAGGGGTQ